MFTRPTQRVGKPRYVSETLLRQHRMHLLIVLPLAQPSRDTERNVRCTVPTPPPRGALAVDQFPQRQWPRLAASDRSQLLNVSPIERAPWAGVSAGTPFNDWKKLVMSSASAAVALEKLPLSASIAATAS